MAGHSQRDTQQDRAQTYEASWQWLFLAAKCSPQFAFVALRELPLETLEEQEPICHSLFQYLLIELEKQTDLSSVNRILLTMTLWRYVALTQNLEETQKTALKDNMGHQVTALIHALNLADDTVKADMRLAFGHALLSSFMEDTQNFYEDVLGHPHPEILERDLTQDIRDLEVLQESLSTKHLSP